MNVWLFFFKFGLKITLKKARQFSNIYNESKVVGRGELLGIAGFLNVYTSFFKPKRLAACVPSTTFLSHQFFLYLSLQRSKSLMHTGRQRTPARSPAKLSAPNWQWSLSITSSNKLLVHHFDALNFSVFQRILFQSVYYHKYFLCWSTIHTLHWVLPSSEVAGSFSLYLMQLDLCHQHMKSLINKPHQLTLLISNPQSHYRHY